MGVKAMAAVMEHSRATLGSRLVMLALADRYNDVDQTDPFPSIEWISKVTLLTPRAIQKCLKRLTDAGELEVQYQASRYGTNVYKMLLPGLSTEGGANFVRGELDGTKVHPNQKEPIRDISNKGSGELRARELRGWEKKGCPHDADFCNRTSRLCLRCDRERRKLMGQAS